MEEYEYLGLILVFLLGLAITVSLFARRFHPRLRQVIHLGYFVHAIGSIVRYLVLYGYYDGGDAGRYFRFGTIYAGMIWAFDFSFFDKRYWEYAQLTGTQFTMFVSGFVISLIGPSKRGEFLFFAILAYAGLLLMIKAFETNFPECKVKDYARWLLFWPSLWFWPSSVGKDSLILFATGLVVFGYTVRLTRIRWIPMMAGIVLASFVRPHVAGVMVVSIAIAHWITPKKKLTATYYIQGFLLLVVLFFVLRQSFSKLGIQDVDVDNLRGYIGTISTRTEQGGSAITTPGVGISGIPMAIVNMLFRPFPWEAGNIFSMAASLEMIVFWTVVLQRRKTIIALAKDWRATRLMRLAVPLTILYVLMLGMAVGNLGIIARQRIHVMPLLFLWLEARAKVPGKIAERPQSSKSPVRLRPAFTQR